MALRPCDCERETSTTSKMRRVSHNPAQSVQIRENRLLDKFAIVPALACLYAVVIFPLLISSCDMTDMVCLSSASPVNQVVWPILCFGTLAVILANRARPPLPVNIACLLALLLFAGLSVTWAFRPELSFIRYMQQVMIVA